MTTFTLLIAVYCYLFFIREDPYRSHADKLVSRILSEVGPKIERQYNIYMVGQGVAMPNNEVRELTLAFDTKRVKSKDELRVLLVQCARDLLDQINRKEELRQYMVEVPFTIKNVQIIIYNTDGEGYSAKDPFEVVAEISQGKLVYKIDDPHDEFKYKSVCVETYEEALKAIQLANQSNINNSSK